MSSGSPSLDALAVVARPEGLFVPALDLFLDPSAPLPRSLSGEAPRAFLSHAHGDHVAGTGGARGSKPQDDGARVALDEAARGPEPPRDGARVFASEETASLVRARFGVATSDPLAWGEPTLLAAPIGPCVLSVVPAGHVLGAAQLVADTPAGRLVYTGDYQPGAGLTHAPGAPVPCDVLVIEATFGLPIFRFPSREAVRADIVSWCTARLAAGETPVLLAYALGKAQELIAALGAAGLPVIAYGSALEMCRAYQALGVALPEVRPIAAGDTEPGVMIVPPWARTQPFLKKRKLARIAYISGWARIDAARERFDADAVFVLSDHADHDELLFTVRASEARRVYTTFGHAAPFAAILRDLGIDARPLEALARDAHEQAEAPPAPTATTPEALEASPLDAPPLEAPSIEAPALDAPPPAPEADA